MFAVSTLSAAAVLIVVSAHRRHAVFAVFLGVVLGIHLAAGIAVHARLVAWAATEAAWVLPAVELTYAWGAASCIGMSAAMVGAPRLRGNVWRVLVVAPGAAWSAGTLLAVPWLAVSGVAQLAVAVPTLGWVTYGLALTGLWTSWVPRREVVRIELESTAGRPRPTGASFEGADAATVRGAGEVPPASGTVVRRTRVARTRVSVLPSAVVPGVLRIVQITDPHLGAFRSEASFRKLCERVVAADPDLVLLTGDYFTMEGAGSPDALGRALAPLRALEGRTFACLGNHDHESPAAVIRGLAEAGVELLVDRAALVDTRCGPVQIVGLDHRWTRARPPQALAPGPQEGPSGHAAVLAACPRPAGVPRIVLLHDPSAFKHLPEGEADLVLSGHTHGGHVGLVSLGLDWTVIGGLSGMPDHGAWARGPDRLYVHRASGHYGFPLRLGVPMEESVLEVVHPAFARQDDVGTSAAG